MVVLISVSPDWLPVVFKRLGSRTHSDHDQEPSAARNTPVPRGPTSNTGQIFLMDWNKAHAPNFLPELEKTPRHRLGYLLTPLCTEDLQALALEHLYTSRVVLREVSCTIFFFIYCISLLARAYLLGQQRIGYVPIQHPGSPPTSAFEDEAEPSSLFEGDIQLCMVALGILFFVLLVTLL